VISWFQSEHAYPNLGAIFGSGVKVVVDEELGTNVLGESIAELQRSKMTSATRKHTKSRKSCSRGIQEKYGSPNERRDMQQPTPKSLPSFFSFSSSFFELVLADVTSLATSSDGKRRCSL